MHTFLALLRDGFHAQEPGGEVELRGDDSAALYYPPSTIHYPLTDYVLQGRHRALL